MYFLFPLAIIFLPASYTISLFVSVTKPSKVSGKIKVLVAKLVRSCH